MSSSSEGTRNNGESEPGSTDHVQWFKKRRLQRACDLCKKKKVRCDGNQMSDSRCSNCVTHKSSCTYIEAMKRKGPLEKYVEYLENRVEKLEQLLRKLPPDSDLLKELNGFFDSSEAPIGKASADDGFLSTDALVLPPQGISLSAQRPIDGRALREEHEDDGVYDVLTQNFNRLFIDPADRHYGKSSTSLLIQTAFEAKKDFARKGNDSTTEPVISNKHQRYRDFQPWQISSLETEIPKFQFPPDGVISCLIDLYFEQINLFFPLLHRPTFERSVAEGLHHTNYWFGASLLLVCALGSQYTDDSHVLWESEVDYPSSGWRWFQQVQLTRQNIPGPPNIYNLQLHCLTILYLQSTCVSPSCWVMLGTAIRLAQDGGAHLKRKKNVEIWTLEDELKTRAFWVLVAMDIGMSCALGRPCATQPEDLSFDLDYPLEVDDDYWEHEDPKQSFKQPQGIPSLTTAFNLLLKLYQLRAFALRTIYSITRSKMRLGYVGDDWKQHIIMELDSALNKWVDAVPDYLRWDPNRENQQHFRQSVLLYTNYHFVRIQIHRSFIPRKSNLSFPSLIMCTSAARSCSNIIDVMRKRQLEVTPFVQLPTFTSGVVLLLNLWSAKRCGLSTDLQKEMSEVYKCMDVLRSFKGRWDSASQLLDMLQTLASVRDPSLLNVHPPMSHKRDREGDTLDTKQAEAPEEPRIIAGSQRVSHAVSHGGLIAADQLSNEQSITPQFDTLQQPSWQPHQPLYNLPLNTNHQSQVSLSFLNQWSSSITGEIAQHDSNVFNQVDSWLLSADTKVNTDTSYQTTLSTLTPDTQTRAYTAPVSMRTTINGMQVMDGSPAAQGSTATHAQRWHDSGPASSTASSVFQFQNSAGWPGVSHFPKTLQHRQLRQVQTGPSAGSPPQDHQQHPQQSLPTLTMHRREASSPSPPFMEPLLEPQQQEPLQPQPQPQQQPAFNHCAFQMWGNTHTTTSELANWSTY